MKGILELLFIFTISCFAHNMVGQETFAFTKAFHEKLQQFELEYLQPTEIWLHPVPYEDEYDEYDMVLYSEDKDVEVRYIFKDSTSPIALSSVPHMEFYRSILDFASNEETSNQIIIQDMQPETAAELYHADWCLTAEFTPKNSISSMSKGKILGIYKKDKGLIFCVMFYKDELPKYFNLPIRFLK